MGYRPFDLDMFWNPPCECASPQPKFKRKEKGMERHTADRYSNFYREINEVNSCSLVTLHETGNSRSEKIIPAHQLHVLETRSRENVECDEIKL